MAQSAGPGGFHTEPSSWQRLLTPSTIGTLTAATLAATPRSLPSQDWLQLPSGADEVLAVIPGRVYCALVGFVLGYGTTKSLEWLRWKLIKRLLSYQGWIYNQKSTRSKLWAVCLKVLKGPGPFRTLDFQNVIPAQPLPDLDASLDKWILVTRNFLTPEEHAQTVEAVEAFRSNEGPKLQAHLQKRFDNKVNWLSDYWLTAAYLSNRSPNAVNSNFYFTNAVPKSFTADPIARAANQVFHTRRYAEYVQSETLPPFQLVSLVPLCMYNYKFLFNSARSPGEHMDTLAHHPGEKHVVVIRRGQYFKLDIYTADATGKTTPLTLEEIYNQLTAIREMADACGDNKPPPVAAMTAQRRDAWHKNRQLLQQKNADTLYMVESALFVIVLDENRPKNHEDQCKLLLAGDGYGRWFDKSFNHIIFDDCTIGANIEHSVIDATVMSCLVEYCMAEERYSETGDIVRNPTTTPRDLQAPSRLSWDMSYMEKELSEAMQQFEILRSEFELCVLNTRYGKAYMKKKRLSPDGYIQMAMQLAYYRMHKEVVKSYEPSTGRLFNLGRTETVHPASQECVEWVKAMDDPAVTTEKREELLRQAIAHQTKFRLDATAGQGCDRHLLGLYCASRETGMDVPNIFLDKPFQMPFKLSTSQTPTRVLETGCVLKLNECGGGFGAVCKDGYGICYIHLGEEMVNLHITAWNTCPETDAHRFSQVLDAAMHDMKTLLQ